MEITSLVILLSIPELIQAIGLPNQHQVACEHSLNNAIHLRCPCGKVLYVQAANYGRLDKETCGYHDNEQCRATRAVDIVRNHCNGKQKCDVRAHNGVFGDPCRGVPKYLEVIYDCVSSGLRSEIVCESQKSNIRCLPGHKLALVGVDYGRHDEITCPSPAMYNLTCHSNVAMKKLLHCNGKESCNLVAKNSVFGNPCLGTYKYLEVRYRCEKTKIIVCESHNSKYKECEFGGTFDTITLIQQKSQANCIHGLRFGINGNRVWVDQACQGTFRLSKTVCDDE
ncbi:L-rhamnose-binding lectin CSL2-like [Argopecten irradians]|uniref:L-rhamnose-binding lectin CSL2-like n=1 Tax=Argopecten irradians TaxID=31199 RepID=UPI00371D364C